MTWPGKRPWPLGVCSVSIPSRSADHVSGSKRITSSREKCSMKSSATRAAGALGSGRQDHGATWHRRAGYVWSNAVRAGEPLARLYARPGVASAIARASTTDNVTSVFSTPTNPLARMTSWL